MVIFLSKQEQQLTEPIFTVGLEDMSREKDLAIITGGYNDKYYEYYLFNRIRVWKSKK